MEVLLYGDVSAFYGVPIIAQLLEKIMEDLENSIGKNSQKTQEKIVKNAHCCEKSTKSNRNNP